LDISGVVVERVKKSVEFNQMEMSRVTVANVKRTGELEHSDGRKKASRAIR
jgi:hypothetical protein